MFHERATTCFMSLTYNRETSEIQSAEPSAASRQALLAAFKSADVQCPAKYGGALQVNRHSEYVRPVSPVSGGRSDVSGGQASEEGGASAASRQPRSVWAFDVALTTRF